MRTKVLLLCVGVVVVSVVSASPTAARVTETNDQANTETPTNNNTISSHNNVTNASNNTANNPTESNVTQANADDSNSATTGSSGTEGQEDDKLPEGMSESLADFVMDMLKGQFSNGTKKTQVPPAPSATNANNTLATKSNATSGESADGISVRNGTDTGGTEKTATEGGEAENKTPHSSTDQWGDDDWSSTENFASTTKEPFSKGGKANCNVEADLNNYCIVDDLVNVYFRGDLTAKGLRSPIFDMDIVERLKSCPRGEWCLDNELDVFRDMMQRFAQGPLCEESMWECILNVMTQRGQCPDKEFMFVVDSADLMCELFADPPSEENEKRCFAHALAALHVTYADFLASDMSDVKPETDAPCDGYGYRMTKTYLCASTSCDALFDSRIAMEKFGRWEWFMNHVESRVVKCGLSDQDTCGALKDKPTTTDRTWFGMTSDYDWSGFTSTTPSTSTYYFSNDYPQAHAGKNGSPGLQNSTKDEDESLMMALSVASAVGLLFMVLGLVFWRRNRRRNLMYHRVGR
ncbi:uncharacterized protein [Littorina saxatilis]|uniref:uncharacterized protein isoform X2 n=1 Tax=Littorina saxatilis TaxID=31220 RepID=UPI0038B50EB6